MAAKWKFLAAGSAAVVAIGGAGLYAGVLSVTSTGTAGAGSAALQASCATSATVTPTAATWTATGVVPSQGSPSSGYASNQVTVAWTSDSAGQCVGQKLRVNVYTVSTGVAVTQNTSAYTIVSGDQTTTAGSTTITLADPVYAGLVASDYKYGVIFQTA